MRERANMGRGNQGYHSTAHQRKQKAPNRTLDQQNMERMERRDKRAQIRDQLSYERKELHDLHKTGPTGMIGNH